MNGDVLTVLAHHWEDLRKEAQPLAFRKGQVLFYAGHSPYGIFVIETGKVEFMQGGTVCPDDHYWKSPRGEALGLHHFFSGTPYCCTCTAANNCKLLFISKTQLTSYLGR